MTLAADVFVLGGGPAGLAAAIALRRRGFDVLLADAARPPIDKACGEGILPEGVAAAHELGIDVAGASLRGIRFSDGPLNAEAAFPFCAGIGVRRTTLHDAMVQRARDLGVRFQWGAAVRSLDDVRARWIIGADGGQSWVRRWAGLGNLRRDDRRFGFVRHYAVAPWTDFVEIHWSDRFQIYITPVAPNGVGVALLTSDPQLRLDSALSRLPGLARLLGSPPGSVRGAVTANRRLRSVCNGRVALIGDASGSVDAITGDGISLAFRQAQALALSLEAGNLSLYSAAHARLSRRPRLMADLLLLLDRYPTLRRVTIRAFAAYPPLFSRMLAAHTSTWPFPPRPRTCVSPPACSTGTPPTSRPVKS